MCCHFGLMLIEEFKKDLRVPFFRTKKIRWMFVVQHFAEVVLVIFYYTFILERLVAPVFRTFDTWPLEPTWFIKIIIEASIPGILIFISSNYLLLHAWMNAWAEMLRFADRLFYKASLNHTIVKLSLMKMSCEVKKLYKLFVGCRIGGIPRPLLCGIVRGTW